MCIRDRISPIRESNGQITHYLAVKEDITERKRMGQELDQHRHKLEELVLRRTEELEVALTAAQSANLAKSAFLANMAPIIFASMVLFLLVGFPVAFALAANGIFFGLIGIELGLLGPQLFQALPDRIFGIMNNDTLLAIPFFTFMGLILSLIHI